tara:strand:+ start:212 stop:529 length:318 start_codon:yes stop_codon:yes gene_type:complete
LFFFTKLTNTNLTNFFNLNNNFFNFTKNEKIEKNELVNFSLTKNKPILNEIMNNIKIFNFNIILLKLIKFIKNTYYKSFSFSFYYMQAMVFVLFIDACLIDDEPL